MDINSNQFTKIIVKKKKLKKKKPNNKKIKELVDKAVEEKLKELYNKKLIVENEGVNVNTDIMENKRLIYRSLLCF